MTRRAWIVLGVTLLALSASASTSEIRLFHIERSKNANIVAYDVRLNPRGTIDTSAPVDGYWVRLAEDGRRKELSGLEKRLAYGWSAKRHGEDGLVLSMKALPDREITVVHGKDGYEAHMPIAGVPARFMKAFVKTKEGGLLPKVLYVDFFGRRLDNGEPIMERQKND